MYDDWDLLEWGSVPCSPEEINLLWENVDEVSFFDMILIGIYNVWRPQQLTILKSANIDLEAGTMKGGMKTDAKKTYCPHPPSD